MALAVAQLRLADPTADMGGAPLRGDALSRMETGYFVEVAVTVQGVTLSQIHPVLDGKNRPIAEPTSFDINTSIQRCLVKAIALHNLGLYIYAGEDLPDGDSGWSKVTSLPTKRTITVGRQRYLTRATGRNRLERTVLDAKGRLIALTSHSSEAGCAVTMTRFWRKGSIDYSTIEGPKANNLEPYRSAPRLETRKRHRGPKRMEATTSPAFWAYR